MAILYFLLFLSVFIDTFKNSYYNFFGKKLLKSNGDTVLFNVICCIGSIAFFGGAIFVLKESVIVSPFSFFLSIAFAAVTVAAQYFGLLSMNLGPMSFSVLFTYLSAMIPTVFGCIYRHELPQIQQVIGLILMIITFILSVDLRKDSGMTLKWILVVAGSFVGMGMIGVFQTIHQVSEFKSEINGFLFWAFVFSFIMFALLYIPYMIKDKKENRKREKFNYKDWSLMLITGIIIGAINLINLYLSGAMPSVIFFPIVNGGVIVLSGLASLIVFKEKLSPKKLAGLIIGIIATCLIGIEL